MQMIRALVAVAILGAGMAVAAEPPPARSATPVNHPSLKVCNKQADARKLTGQARAQFVHDCHAGKTPGKGAEKSSPKSS